MKIKADYANAPQWKELTVKSSLPEELKCLELIRELCRTLFISTTPHPSSQEEGTTARQEVLYVFFK